MKTEATEIFRSNSGVAGYLVRTKSRMVMRGRCDDNVVSDVGFSLAQHFEARVDGIGLDGAAANYGLPHNAIYAAIDWGGHVPMANDPIGAGRWVVMLAGRPEPGTIHNGFGGHRRVKLADAETLAWTSGGSGATIMCTKIDGANDHLPWEITAWLPKGIEGSNYIAPLRGGYFAVEFAADEWVRGIEARLAEDRIKNTVPAQFY